MGVEIERKFLVKNLDFKKTECQRFIQGYLSTDKNTVRVRLVGDLAWLTIKGKTEGFKRAEFEYEIPASDAKDLLENLCHKPLIEKDRYFVEDQGFLWEVDVFHGENEGLVVAELELEHENIEVIKPSWVGEEVTHDHRYSNARLVSHPYKNWKD